MSSRASLVAYVVEQLGQGARSRAMFGEYGIYRGDTLIALFCDDRLFLKKTERGCALLGDDVEEGFPYPGAKPALVVPEERWDDRELMIELARATAAELALYKKRVAPKKTATNKAPTPKKKATKETARRR